MPRIAHVLIRRPSRSARSTSPRRDVSRRTRIAELGGRRDLCLDAAEATDDVGDRQPADRIEQVTLHPPRERLLPADADGHGTAGMLDTPMVPESKLEKTEHGLTPTGTGWYVLNLRDAEWRHADGRGAVCVVSTTSRAGAASPTSSASIPSSSCRASRCPCTTGRPTRRPSSSSRAKRVLIVEGEERQLRAWDFVHSPPGTKHVIVGAGTGPCLVIAVGAREHDGEPDSLGFTVDEVASRHGASVEEDTMDGDDAYAAVPGREPTAYRDGWLPE